MSNSLLGPGNVPRKTGIHHPVKGMERLGSKPKLSVNSTFPTRNSLLTKECFRTQLSTATLPISTKYTAQNTTPKSHEWFQTKIDSTEQTFWNPCKPKRSRTRHRRYQVGKKKKVKMRSGSILIMPLSATLELHICDCHF